MDNAQKSITTHFCTNIDSNDTTFVINIKYVWYLINTKIVPGTIYVFKNLMYNAFFDLLTYFNRIFLSSLNLILITT